jgi:ribose transport system substrate-binding protein
MKKKLLAMVMTAAVALSMAACGSSTSSSSATETETEESTVASTVAEAEESTDDASTATEAKDASDISVILVTMDGLDNHWVNVDAGASAAAEELGINYQWMQPDKKDTQLQIEVLNNAIAADPDVLIVAAVDPDAIVSTLQSALDAGIKLIYVDSAANIDASASFRTDNYAAGEEAGKQELEQLEAKGITSGDIGVVSFSNATQTAVDRTGGFVSVFEDTDFNILEVQYGNSEVAASQAAAENFISQGVVGLYGDNEPGAVGVGNAVAANADWEGVAVGFDATSASLDLVDKGALYCVMAQNPKAMGDGAVRAAYTLATGGTLEETDVDTGATVVTKENSADFR